MENEIEMTNDQKVDIRYQNEVKEILIWDFHTYMHIGEPLLVLPENIVLKLTIGGIETEVDCDRYFDKLKRSQSIVFRNLVLDIKSSSLDYSRAETIDYLEPYAFSIVYKNGNCDEYLVPSSYIDNLDEFYKVYDADGILRISIDGNVNANHELPSGGLCSKIG